MSLNPSRVYYSPYAAVLPYATVVGNRCVHDVEGGLTGPPTTFSCCYMQNIVVDRCVHEDMEGKLPKRLRFAEPYSYNGNSS